VQEQRVLMPLPKALVWVAALLLAGLAAGAGASTAAAHGNHAHQVSTNASGSVFSIQPAEIMQVARAHVAANDETRHKSPDQNGKSECCCGSVMCHAGLTVVVNAFALLSPAGARVIAEPPSGRSRRNSSGLERPPRSPDIA
jgi:hypothetical protein